MKRQTLVSKRDLNVFELSDNSKIAQSDADFADWTFDSVKSILETLRIVDESTYLHCLRVGEACRRLARDLGLNQIQQRSAHFAGMLHDIGKMGISSDILNKPSRLTNPEFEIMKNHSCLSEAIIRPLSRQNKFIELILSGVRGHHERIDGSGYPDRLEGDAIPLYSRIILVSDTYDAMKNNRSYRNGLDNESIYSELKRCAGTQFDFQIVKTFLQAHPTWNESKDVDYEVLNRIGSSSVDSLITKKAA
jgi:HD-GYP domain-containing protein (c-di-GMP phosphodiesterase class II)